MNIQIVLFDGFDELDVFAPFEVLRMAATHVPGMEVRLVAGETVTKVTSNRGVQITPQGTLGQPVPDLVIVPGGGWMDKAPQGARAEFQRGVLPAVLAKLHSEGVIMASVCTGAMLLSAAGLLKGRPAVTHHGAMEELRAAGAQIMHARVVDDGNVITAGGVTSGLDLALWIVERFISVQGAQQIETQLEYERRGSVWRRSLKETPLT